MQRGTTVAMRNGWAVGVAREKRFGRVGAVVVMAAEAEAQTADQAWLKYQPRGGRTVEESCRVENLGDSSQELAAWGELCGFRAIGREKAVWLNKLGLRLVLGTQAEFHAS